MIQTLIILLCLVSSPLWAATRTSSQSGNWSSSSTWGGAAAPGNADDAVISSGHTVTVDTAVTVGNSGASGTVAIVVTGTLQVNAPLTIRGGIQINNSGTVTGSTAGANTGSLICDPASGTTYAVTTTGTGTPTLTPAGGAGDFFVLSTDTGRGGSACTLSYTFASASTFTTDYVLWANMGTMAVGFGSFTNTTFDLNHTDFRGSASTIISFSGTGANTTGTRRIRNSTFYSSGIRSLQMWARGITVEDSNLINTRLIGDVNADNRHTYSRNLHLFNGGLVSGGWIPMAAEAGYVVEDSGFIVDQTGTDNPHYLSEYVSTQGIGIANISRGNVCDGLGTSGSDSGDFHITLGAITITQFIAINRCGAWTPSHEPTGRISATRLTLYDTAGANANETAGGANVFVRTSSSLFVNLQDALHQETTFVTQSTSWNWDYNRHYNCSNAANFDVAGSNGCLGPATIATWKSGATYGDDNFGLHDTYGDPVFVDSTRTANTWYVYRHGGTFSTANLIAALAAMNGTDTAGASTTATGDTAALYVAYIRAGFTPTDATLNGAGDPDDGSPDIGAVDFTPGGGNQTRVPFLRR